MPHFQSLLTLPFQRNGDFNIPSKLVAVKSSPCDSSNSCMSLHSVQHNFSPVYTGTGQFFGFANSDTENTGTANKNYINFNSNAIFQCLEYFVYYTYFDTFKISISVIYWININVLTFCNLFRKIRVVGISLSLLPIKYSKFHRSLSPVCPFFFNFLLLITWLIV